MPTRFAPILVTTALILGLAPVLLATQQEPPPAPVKVSTAVQEEMAPQIWVPGTVVSRQHAALAAEVSGRLVWMADIGDAATAGEVVARIDDQALRLQLKNDDATVLRLEANLEYLEQQVARFQRLTQEQVVARNDLDEVAAQMKATEQELVQAEVAREQTRFRLARTEVRAPFSGRVVERLQQPGGYIGVGGEIVRLVDTDNIEVRAQAPLSVAPFVSEGLTVTVADKTLQASAPIRRVVAVGDERSRMFEIRVDLPGSRWMIGTPVRVALPSDRPLEVVAVPRDALVLRSDNTYVFKVTEDGTVERVVVETGAGTNALISVRGDIVAGDQVVVRGGERLQPGQSVAVDTVSAAGP